VKDNHIGITAESQLCNVTGNLPSTTSKEKEEKEISPLN